MQINPQFDTSNRLACFLVLHQCTGPLIGCTTTWWWWTSQVITGYSQWSPRHMSLAANVLLSLWVYGQCECGMSRKETHLYCAWKCSLTKLCWTPGCRDWDGPGDSTCSTPPGPCSTEEATHEHISYVTFAVTHVRKIHHRLSLPKLSRVMIVGKKQSTNSCCIRCWCKLIWEILQRLQ